MGIAGCDVSPLRKGLVVSMQCEIRLPAGSALGSTICQSSARVPLNPQWRRVEATAFVRTANRHPGCSDIKMDLSCHGLHTQQCPRNICPCRALTICSRCHDVARRRAATSDAASKVKYAGLAWRAWYFEGPGSGLTLSVLANTRGSDRHCHTAST